MISLIAGIGIGSILAAIIGWFVAISNHRQEWINALRDDLALYLKELEVMHYAIGDLLHLYGPSAQPFEQKKREARIAVLFVYRRIQLRLNPNEALHNQLMGKLDRLQLVETATPDPILLMETANIAQEVLRQEWEACKLGPLAKPVLKLKQWREARNQ